MKAADFMKQPDGKSVEVASIELRTSDRHCPTVATAPFPLLKIPVLAIWQKRSQVQCQRALNLPLSNDIEAQNSRTRVILGL